MFCGHTMTFIIRDTSSLCGSAWSSSVLHHNLCYAQERCKWPALQSTFWKIKRWRHLHWNLNCPEIENSNCIKVCV